MKKIDVVFAVIAAVAVAIAVSSVLQRRNAESVLCGNYMSSIGFAARAWADDNNRRLPGNFVVMSNELAMTKILICPGDRSRQPAKDWSSFRLADSSYELLTPGLPWNDTNAFLRCQIHGYSGYADGTVFDGKHRRSKIFFER